MSKAFTRESDDETEPPLGANLSPTLPPGTPNLMTARGAARLRAELERLIEIERPQQLALAEQTGNKRPLQRVSQRIVQIQQSLQSAEIVAPPNHPSDAVCFGAAVTVRHRDAETVRYRIVGAAEADPDRGDLSWISPIARALLNARAGDRVRVTVPAGEIELEVLAVANDAGD